MSGISGQLKQRSVKDAAGLWHVVAGVCRTCRLLGCCTRILCDFCFGFHNPNRCKELLKDFSLSCGNFMQLCGIIATRTSFVFFFFCFCTGKMKFLKIWKFHYEIWNLYWAYYVIRKKLNNFIASSNSSC